VLLVDDDPMVLLAMQALLGSWKVDLRCANRGDESVFLLCSPDWAPECVLSDFRLPGPLNGIALLDELLDHYPHAVGILQTGELREAVQTQAQESGYLVLFKPIDPAKLAATLSAVLGCRTHEKLL
jgi:DNA-binding NtrC family response regulator